MNLRRQDDRNIVLSQVPVEWTVRNVHTSGECVSICITPETFNELARAMGAFAEDAS